MESYCHYLNIYNAIKSSFLAAAFVSNITGCSNNTTNAVGEATKLHTFTETNPTFLNMVKKGCQMGGNNTKCKIGNSNIDEVFDKFNVSYYCYIKNPSYLCTAFSEYANDDENIFITGGCYLNRSSNNDHVDKERRICKFMNGSSDRGYSCI